MGRNAIPKLNEWRDRVLYRFRWIDGDGHVSTPESGRLVIYERLTADKPEHPETLATAWADGLQELMAAMFADGYSRGKREGYTSAQSDIRRALGVSQ